MPSTWLRISRLALLFGILAIVLTPIRPAVAQQDSLRPGEAYVTRFSGTTQGPDGAAAINPAGTVGRIALSTSGLPLVTGAGFLPKRVLIRFSCCSMRLSRSGIVPAAV